MTPETKVQEVEQMAAKQNDKEFNFAQLRKQLEQEKLEKQRLEEENRELKKGRPQVNQMAEEEEVSDEPYVDERRLNKKLEKFEQKFDRKVEQAAEMKARELLDQERKNSFLKQNPDFHEILRDDLIQKFAEKHPEIAEPMLEMPANFARQKLLYQNIKALGLHKKEEPKPSIQETIDRNRRSPYYQPSGVGSPPQGMTGDFSESGQKNGYQKLKELQKRLRL